MSKIIATRYDTVARSLHWLLAFMIVMEYLIALVMGDFGLKWLHLQLGYAILILVLLRITWRLTHKYPEMDKSLSRTNQILAHSGHGVLYLLMLAIPSLGLALVITKGVQYNVFGIPVGPFMEPMAKASRHQIKEVHEFLAHTIIIMAAIHALVALLHQFVLGHPILSRMLPEKLAAIVEGKNVKK